MNASITKLLTAQKIDHERLVLLQALTKGSVKVELDKANQTIVDSKKNLLQLEADAKNLKDNYEKVSKIITETLALVKQANQAQSQDMGEYGDYLSKLSILESQLADIERKIMEKSSAFKNATVSVVKASDFVKKNLPTYEQQKQQTDVQVKALEKQFAEATNEVDEKLLAKYKAARKSKVGDVKDVLVPLTADRRCQGCYMDVPAAITSKISADGWALCEECGRIIYKAWKLWHGLPIFIKKLTPPVRV